MDDVILEYLITDGIITDIINSPDEDWYVIDQEFASWAIDALSAQCFQRVYEAEAAHDSQLWLY